ncbi:universal stress protein [Halorubrum vacuolatum]|nr:universal stress protein [Halorubrum vacuolatum]
MYNKILVAVDGSSISDAAVEHTLDLAELTGAEVHALYVVETKASYIITVDLTDEELDEYNQYGEELVTEVVKKATERGISKAKGAVKRGKAGPEIVEYADEKGIDAIVIGKQGHGAINKLVGSTADKVLQLSDIPVTIVR